MKTTSGLSPTLEPGRPADTVAVFLKPLKGDSYGITSQKCATLIMTGGVTASDVSWIKIFRDRRFVREPLCDYIYYSRGMEVPKLEIGLSVLRNRRYTLTSPQILSWVD